MAFFREVVRDRHLGFALARALLIGCCVFFVAEVIEKYLFSYGWTLKPIMDGRASVRVLLDRGWWGAALGAVFGLAFVYFGWKWGKKRPADT